MTELLVRRLPGLTLATGWSRVAQRLPGDACVLIACMDSNRAPGASTFLLGEAQAHDPGATVHHGRIVMAARALAAFVADRRAFAGFDEVWVFAGAPAADVVEPETIGLTSETPVEPAPALSGWFEETGCLLGLGDGDGLNYATPSRALAAALEGGARS